MAAADDSNGYEQIAERFISARSLTIGTAVVREWSRLLVPGASILDIGCGNGLPIGRMLTEAGFVVYGIDASPKMIDAFR